VDHHGRRFRAVPRPQVEAAGLSATLLATAASPRSGRAVRGIVAERSSLLPHAAKGRVRVIATVIAL